MQDTKEIGLHKLREIRSQLVSFKEKHGHLCPKNIHLLEKDIKGYEE